MINCSLRLTLITSIRFNMLLIDFQQQCDSFYRTGKILLGESEIVSASITLHSYSLSISSVPTSPYEWKLFSF